MPRSPRADEAGGLYRALNRANLGAKIFRKTGDFVAFEKVLHEALQLYKVELYAYQIIGTHWHLMLRPDEADQAASRARNAPCLGQDRRDFVPPSINFDLGNERRDAKVECPECPQVSPLKLMHRCLAAYRGQPEAGLQSWMDVLCPFDFRNVFLISAMTICSETIS